MDDESDIRQAAFARLHAIGAHQGALPWESLSAGFYARGQHFYLATKARGIFKPKAMQGLLSIKTVYPRAGRKAWYEDQESTFARSISGQETLSYALQGTDPHSHDNQLLYRAYLERTPFIYFLGIAPGFYQAIFPVFVEEWEPAHLRVGIAISASAQDATRETSLGSGAMQAARRYGLSLTKRRLHQARFRLSLLDAYGRRCALTGFPEERLLDGAHIIPDAHPDQGQPVVQNGLLLSRLHHGAFDAHLLGIDADMRIHISPRMRTHPANPMLQALLDLDGHKILQPARPQDAPDPARLEQRLLHFQGHH